MLIPSAPVSHTVAALLVALGGAAGAVLRYAVGAWTVQTWPDARWPWGTLAVNLVGSLAIGVLAPGLARHDALRMLVVTGVLGGFTTFSAFSLDALALLHAGRAGAAFGYVAVSTVGGLALCVLGWRIAAP